MFFSGRIPLFPSRAKSKFVNGEEGGQVVMRLRYAGQVLNAKYERRWWWKEGIMERVRA